jgi:hypothetical protein
MSVRRHEISAAPRDWRPVSLSAASAWAGPAWLDPLTGAGAVLPGGEQNAGLLAGKACGLGAMRLYYLVDQPVEDVGPASGQLARFHYEDGTAVGCQRSPALPPGGHRVGAGGRAGPRRPAGAGPHLHWSRLPGHRSRGRAAVPAQPPVQPAAQRLQPLTILAGTVTWTTGSRHHPLTSQTQLGPGSPNPLVLSKLGRCGATLTKHAQPVSDDHRKPWG